MKAGVTGCLRWPLSPLPPHGSTSLRGAAGPRGRGWGVGGWPALQLGCLHPCPACPVGVLLGQGSGAQGWAGTWSSISKSLIPD